MEVAAPSPARLRVFLLSCILIVAVAALLNIASSCRASSSATPTLHFKLPAAASTAIPPALPSLPPFGGPPTCDLVIIFTVWRRATLGAYFRYIERQDLFAERGPAFRTCITVFQNGAHLNVSDIVAQWSAPGKWGARAVTITHIQSVVATGYYGRFLAPLLAPVRDDSYFIVCDDDVIFGAYYISSMLRVVDGGDVATRNGRFVSFGSDAEGKPCCVTGDRGGASEGGWKLGLQVAAEADIPYDYGGHMWAGRVAWLRTSWSSFPPQDLTTAEDFWLSATLKSKLGVGTKRVRCPLSDVEFCACSMHIAHNHQPAEVGGQVGGEDDRGRVIVKHILATGFVSLPQEARVAENRSLIFGHFWNTSGESIFRDCLFFT